MSHPLEYLTKNALLFCDKGATPSPFQPTMCEGVKVRGMTVSNVNDKVPLTHILPFGACAVMGGAPCVPAPVMWQDTFHARVRGGETLLVKSSCQCSVGGKITPLTSGQVPLPPGELEALTEEHAEPEEDEGWGWWDTAELIPVIGNVIGMVREAKKGNWGMVALNAAFLVLDVVTLGTASAVTTPLKGAVKAGVKYATKTAAKAATKGGLKAVAKSGAKAFARGVSKAVSKVAGKNGILCVFACFARDTLIAGEHGDVPIQAIKEGDRVWAFDEDTQALGLKKVARTMQRRVDATVTLSIADEAIRTTAEHPFMTQIGWKAASTLQPGDSIRTKAGAWHAIKEISWNYESEIVYNFEVEHYSTYFVGAWQWLVHNAKVCLLELAEAGVKYAKDIINGQLFDRAMAQAYELSQVVMKNGKRLDALVPGVEIVSHKYTQLADVTLSTAKGYISEIGAKYTGMTNSKKVMDALGKQVELSNLERILEVPKQLGDIPEEVLKHAKRQNVKIREISGDALEAFNKVNFF